MMGWSFPAVLPVVECQGIETHTNRGLKMQESKERYHSAFAQVTSK